MSAPFQRVHGRAPAVRLAAAAGLAAAIALLACGCGGSGSTGTGGAASAAGTRTTGATGGGLVAQGSRLYESDGCAGCHSLNGTRLTGPSWKGLAGSRVQLADGRTLIADDAYLTRHIVEPNALTVRGYPADIMQEAIEELDLKHHPAQVRALVAFIDSLR